MYFTHFGLRARPFRTTPDDDAYYPATTHENALAELRRGLADEEGSVILMGGPGMGKTLMAHRLIDGMPTGVRTVFLTNCHFASRADLLQGILFDLGLHYQMMSEQELRLLLTESCLDHFGKSGPTVIVIDEAHLLSDAHLEEVRLLGNLEGKEGKAVQVVLIGLPSIGDTLKLPGLRIFRQRVSVFCMLEPLSIEESADYLLHQIRRAGGQPEKLLGEDVLDILCHASRGIPRVLNQSAHLAFTLANQAGSSSVDAEAAVEAVTRLGLDEGSEAPSPGEEPEPPPPPPAPAAAAVREAFTIPLTPVPTVALQMARSDGPPTYVYGGEQSADANDLDRASKQRAG
jgi:type II secretory pathway predicted ATPase ExeA